MSPLLLTGGLSASGAGVSDVAMASIAGGDGGVAGVCGAAGVCWVAGACGAAGVCCVAGVSEVAGGTSVETAGSGDTVSSAARASGGIRFSIARLRSVSDSRGGNGRAPGVIALAATAGALVRGLSNTLRIPSGSVSESEAWIT